MPTTLTSSLVNAVRAGTKNIPIVPNRTMATVVSHTVNGGTVTVGQVIQMVPIPSGSEILDIAVIANFFNDAGVGVYTIGDGSSTGRYAISASLTNSSIIARLGGGLGYKYSVSDDVAVGFGRFDTIDMSLGAGVSQCNTASIMMVVYWRYLGVGVDPQ